MKFFRLFYSTFIFLTFSLSLNAGSYTTAEILVPEHFVTAPCYAWQAQLQSANCQSLLTLYNELIAKGNDSGALFIRDHLTKEKLIYHLTHLRAKRLDNELKYRFVYSLQSSYCDSNILKVIADELHNFKIPYRALSARLVNEVFNSQLKYSVRKELNAPAVIMCKNGDHTNRTLSALFMRKLASIANKYYQIEFDLIVILTYKPKFTYELGIY